ncbi:hypothetical protein [Legionella sp. 16cNR16C]|uniref:hypothetical protein n=1 Tax=Legionella sp. 16cNR16C TaxID=2905656 RepID=UPI001E361108|nr:hypothetical protein [Legionella sp. 16cNR16C]MCE3045753.1 hypothetical protein [Legionella sp. 16cNR16C]
MRKSGWLLGLFFSGFVYQVHAAVFISYKEIWHCHAHDYTDQRFIALSSNEWTALRNAKLLCKSQSKQPKTCTISREDCDAMVNGVSVRPLWQCTAMDSLAHVWKSGIYRVADNAINGAKTRCYSHSAVPSTCHVNHLTCKNLNPY